MYIITSMSPLYSYQTKKLYLLYNLNKLKKLCLPYNVDKPKKNYVSPIALTNQKIMSPL